MRLPAGLITCMLLASCAYISLAVSAGAPRHNEGYFPDLLDGAYTGGFGEPTCHSCHFDYDINDPRGNLSLEGIDEPWQPGKSYRLNITVRAEQLRIAGFQMTARFEDGSQAGAFEFESGRLSLTPAVSDSVQYIQHSEAGTAPTGDREASWMLTWIAPDEATRPVRFNIAANSGNDDDSAFGDWIFVKEQVVAPAD